MKELKSGMTLGEVYPLDATYTILLWIKRWICRSAKNVRRGLGKIIRENEK